MCVVNVLLFNQIKTVCKVHIEKKGRTCIVKKTYVKPVITKKVSVKNNAKADLTFTISKSKLKQKNVDLSKCKFQCKNGSIFAK